MKTIAWILLVWFGFPPIAIICALLFGLRNRLTPETPKPRKPELYQSFVPTSYIYYPERRREEPEDLPLPAIGSTRKRDRVCATLAIILGVIGLYLPLLGMIPAVAAMLLARPVVQRRNHYCIRADVGFFLGMMTFVQLGLYFGGV